MSLRNNVRSLQRKVQMQQDDEPKPLYVSCPTDMPGVYLMTEMNLGKPSRRFFVDADGNELADIMFQPETKGEN